MSVSQNAYGLLGYKGEHEITLVEAVDFVLSQNPRGNHDWLRFPSNGKFLDLASPVISNLRRKNVPLPEVAHTFGVADRLFNCKHLDHIPNDVRAHTGTIHDHPELMQKMGRSEIDPTYIVDRTWCGKPEHKPYLIRVTELATDPQILHGRARLQHQVKTAHLEQQKTQYKTSRYYQYRGLYSLLRYYDKTEQYETDFWGLKNGKSRIKSIESADRFLDKFHLRCELVWSLPIPAYHKDRFAQLERKIEREIRRIKEEITKTKEENDKIAFAKRLNRIVIPKNINNALS